MVNPIASGADIGLASPLTQDVSRGSHSDPTRRVTATNETLGSNTSTEGHSPQPLAGSAEPLAKALEELNGRLEAWSTGMRFDIDQDAQRVVVSIVDNATGEVLRTVPSDAVIRVAKMIVQLQGQGIRTQA